MTVPPRWRRMLSFRVMLCESSATFTTITASEPNIRIMAFIQIESDNPQLSFLLRKNPASGMIVKQLRQGLLFGYYSHNNPTQFNCWFKDHDSQVSYDADKEFEFNDVTRYSAATFVNNCFDEFLTRCSHQRSERRYGRISQRNFYQLYT